MLVSFGYVHDQPLGSGHFLLLSWRGSAAGMNKLLAEWAASSAFCLPGADLVSHASHTVLKSNTIIQAAI
jgi:hypothetical protein